MSGPTHPQYQFSNGTPHLYQTHQKQVFPPNQGQNLNQVQRPPQQYQQVQGSAFSSTGQPQPMRSSGPPPPHQFPPSPHQFPPSPQSVPLSSASRPPTSPLGASQTHRNASFNQPPTGQFRAMGISGKPPGMTAPAGIQNMAGPPGMSNMTGPPSTQGGAGPPSMSNMTGPPRMSNMIGPPSMSNMTGPPGMQNISSSQPGVQNSQPATMQAPGGGPTLTQQQRYQSPPVMSQPMPPQSMSGMPPPQTGGIPSSQMGRMPLSQMGRMPPQQVGGMQPQPMGGMPPQPMSGMPPQPMSGMPPQPMSGMPPQPMSGMPPQPMGGMPPQPMGGMQPQPMGGMPPQMGEAPGLVNRPSQPMSGPQPKRIDPNQMPNPIQVMKDDQSNFNGEVFATSSRGKVPPLVSTKCRIQDDGNCSPRFMRSTVYSIPCNQDMLKESGIPMAVVSTPFAKIPADENQMRYVDHGANGPVRCNRCKAYMNPFMQFIDGGRRFVCNICSHSSEVPQEYFCHLDHQGKRVDIYERPELCFGSYEFVATTDYCKDSKLPGPPAFIFMIDVSYQSMHQGMVKLLSEELHTLLDNLPKDVGMDESIMKVGFVTYNTQLHFYNVKENLAQPQMMVVTDLEDAFVPLLDGFLVNYKEAKGVVDSLLDMLPEMFRDTRETDVVLGPVVAAGIEAIKSACISGKLLIFHSSLPIAEAPGKLKNREDRKLLATDKEKTILMPQGNYYMNLAKECVKNGVSIDLFLFPNSYVDVATVGLMVTQTGGQVYRYSYFKEGTHGKQFISDLRKNFKRDIGFDAIMRLRCSAGLRPVEFYGSFSMNNTTDVELASIDSDKAIAIEIKHDDKISEDGVAFVQNALLYTSPSGQRRLRIHNLAFSTCSQLADLYRCCELDTTVNFLSKHALRQILSSTPQTIKDNLIQRCVQVLACYRQHCATPSTSGQLILPECMKLLPLYVNCLIKSDVLAGGSEMSSDDRAFLMQVSLSMPPMISSSYFYPRVIPLHTIDVNHEEELVPDQIRCLGDKFEDSGVYLLENTISMFIWVGLQTNIQFLQEVFGANTIGQLDIEMTHLPEIDSLLSKRVRQIIEAIQSERQRYLKLTVVRQRDKLEPWFKHYIVEDKGFNANQLSYVDFLCHVHKEIRSLLS